MNFKFVLVMNFECLNLNKNIVFDVVCENCLPASFSDCILVSVQPAISCQGSPQSARSISPAVPAHSSLLAHKITFDEIILYKNNLPTYLFCAPLVK